MKHRRVYRGTVFCCLYILLASVSAVAGPKDDCEMTLRGLGYSLTSYSFEEAGWISKEKHIFNGSIICYISSEKEVHSIEDNNTVIVKDGFYGEVALAKRDELNAERRAAIKAERRKAAVKKNQIDEQLERAERKINKVFDGKIEEVKLNSAPPATAEAREVRKRQMEEARREKEEQIAREKVKAEEAKRKAEEEEKEARAIARKVRQAEVDAIESQTGSTVSLAIAGASEQACADLLAGHIRNIDVHLVQSESMWGGKFSVWYRDRDRDYLPDQYNTRKCQISGGSVKILSVFQNWE